MGRKRVLFIADSLDNAQRFQQVLTSMDTEVVAGSSAQLKRLIATDPGFDLLILEAAADASGQAQEAERCLEDDGRTSLLVIVPPDALPSFRLPVQVRSDFIVSGASADECSVRVSSLLWPGNETNVNDFVVIDGMTINLATYQVKVAGVPLDLTYLEYALLAFLVTHPGRTYSRDALLQRVWGFDYYGGSRTVDVHVRRVRAKLGPELAQRLETVRGVGYLWMP